MTATKLGWDSSKANLSLQPLTMKGNFPSESRIYNPSQNIVCTVTKDGRVMRDGVDITDDDAAMSQCFIDTLKFTYNIEVKRG